MITLPEGAGKSLVRPTSRCCRAESIVSLERGVRPYKSFLVTEAERKHVRQCTQFHQRGDTSCHQIFSCKARRLRKFTPL